MSTVNLQVQQYFPIGSTVSAYQLHDSPGDGPPPADASATGIVDVFGTLTLTGLEANEEFLAGALVNGRWRYVEFTTFQFNDPSQVQTGGLDASLLGAAGGIPQLNEASQIYLNNLPPIPASKVAADVATKAQLDAVAATVITGPRPALPGTGVSRVPTYGTLGAPLTSAPTVSFADVPNGTTSSDLYAVMYIGANLSFAISNQPASAWVLTLEVHQVGGPWTLAFKSTTVLTEGGEGIDLTTDTVNAIDMLTIWSPDGSSLRGTISRNFS